MVPRKVWIQVQTQLCRRVPAREKGFMPVEFETLARVGTFENIEPHRRQPLSRLAQLFVRHGCLALQRAQRHNVGVTGSGRAVRGPAGCRRWTRLGVTGAWRRLWNRTHL